MFFFKHFIVKNKIPAFLHFGDNSFMDYASGFYQWEEKNELSTIKIRYFYFVRREGKTKMDRILSHEASLRIKFYV
jgi:hypothetical protein